MLVTNETVADFLASKKLPCVYRSHDNPDDDRIEQAFILVEELTGKEFADKPRTVDRITEALDALEGHPLQRIASIALLKAMQKATYTIETEGHFGIGATRYAHFTSPIRRYADLEVHRVLRAAIDAPELIKPSRWERQLREGAKSANAGEFRAVQAERYAERLMKARYMLDHVGEEFSGRVTGVTNFGTFVTLEDTPIEGLAHISGFKDDHYVYDEKLEQLKGRRKGRVIKLGQKIRVKCRRVILHEGKVDLQPLEWGE
jgi:ribonuclease R